MSGKQDQRVAEGGTAIQSQRDTIIHTGLNSEDMRAIVESLSDQMPKLVSAAAAVMESRLKAFETDVLKRFEEDAATNKQAFADPDFQHVVIEAQRAYGRTGDTDTHGTLIDLIAKRSTEPTGCRRAFAINEAIEVVARLTRNEISELAFAFYVRRTQNRQITSFEKFCDHAREFINELVLDIEVDDISYEYLVAQRCAAISIGSIDIIDAWRRTYPGIFMKGFTAEQVESLVKETSSSIMSLLVPCQFNPGLWQPRAMTLEVLLHLDREPDVSKENVEHIWKQAVANLANDEEIVEKMKPQCPGISEAVEKWRGSQMKSLELTAIGQAIAHARLTQIPAFGKPELSIWVK